MATKILLEEIYDFEEGYGKENDDYLKQHNIHTFLVKRKNENEIAEINLDGKRIQFETEPHDPTFSISNGKLKLVNFKSLVIKNHQILHCRG